LPKLFFISSPLKYDITDLHVYSIFSAVFILPQIKTIKQMKLIIYLRPNINFKILNALQILLLFFLKDVDINQIKVNLIKYLKYLSLM